MTTESNRLVERIPDTLLELWRKGPLRFAKDDNLPVVRLENRMLTLNWGMTQIIADAADCHYRIGRPWKMKRGARAGRPLLPFGKHDLILIDFPPLQKGFFGNTWAYTTAPVGYTQTSLTNWVNALAFVVDDFDAREY